MATWLFVLLAPTSAWAQTVLLAHPSGDDPVLVEGFNRLRAELRLEQFEVEVIELEAGANPAGLSRAAKAADAFAAVVMIRAAGTTKVDVWISDRITGKMVMQTLELEDVADAPSVLALRAVDLLRSSLRDLERQPSASPEVVGVDRALVSRAVRDFARPERDYRVAVAAAAIATGAPGNAFGGTLSFGRELGPVFVALSFSGPLLGVAWTTPLGTAVAHQELLFAEASYDVLSAGPLALAPTLALGGYLMVARGDVEAPLQSQQDHVLSALVAPGLQARVRLFGDVQGVADGRTLFLTPRPGLGVDDREVLLPNPLLMVTLGLGVEF